MTTGAVIEKENNQYNNNERYIRNYLRPIAKSVYQDKKVVRLNGSLQTSIKSPGFDQFEKAKGLQSATMQVQMT